MARITTLSHIMCYISDKDARERFAYLAVRNFIESLKVVFEDTEPRIAGSNDIFYDRLEASLYMSILCSFDRDKFLKHVEIQRLVTAYSFNYSSHIFKENNQVREKNYWHSCLTFEIPPAQSREILQQIKKFHNEIAKKYAENTIPAKNRKRIFIFILCFMVVGGLAAYLAGAGDWLYLVGGLAATLGFGGAKWYESNRGLRDLNKKKKTSYVNRFPYYFDQVMKTPNLLNPEERIAVDDFDQMFHVKPCPERKRETIGRVPTAIKGHLECISHARLLERVTWQAVAEHGVIDHEANSKDDPIPVYRLDYGDSGEQASSAPSAYSYDAAYHSYKTQRVPRGKGEAAKAEVVEEKPKLSYKSIVCSLKPADKKRGVLATDPTGRKIFLQIDEKEEGWHLVRKAAGDNLKEGVWMRAFGGPVGEFNTLKSEGGNKVTLKLSQDGTLQANELRVDFVKESKEVIRTEQGDQVPCYSIGSIHGK